jgi:hypothetical protein
MGNRSSLNAALAYAIFSLSYCQNISGFIPNTINLPWRWRHGAGVTTVSNRGEHSGPIAALNGKHLSASDRERRDEEKRRKERQGEVIIGKTSARPGEKDFPLDPVATECTFD